MVQIVEARWWINLWSLLILSAIFHKITQPIDNYKMFKNVNSRKNFEKKICTICLVIFACSWLSTVGCHCICRHSDIQVWVMYTYVTDAGLKFMLVNDYFLTGLLIGWQPIRRYVCKLLTNSLISTGSHVNNADPRWETYTSSLV